MDLYGTQILTHEPRIGQTIHGTPLYASPVSILGFVRINDYRDISGTSERRIVQSIAYIADKYTVAIGDRIEGREIIQELPERKYILK